MEFREGKDTEADKGAADLLLRQCITTEGPVKTLDSNGFCVPLGEPDPNSVRIVVAAHAKDQSALTGLMQTDC